MTLAEYRSSKDPNLYWRLSEGDRQNLLEEAIESIDRQQEELRSKFVQGFLCAITTMIVSHGVSVPIREAFRSCFTKFDDIYKHDIDEYDLAVLTDNRKELE